MLEKISVSKSFLILFLFTHFAIIFALYSLITNGFPKEDNLNTAKNSSNLISPNQNCNENANNPNNQLNENSEIYRCMFPSAAEKVVTKGQIKALPDDRDLGQEKMYFIYFNEPFILWDNATGYPQFMDSLELVSNEENKFDFEKYVNKEVLIAGELTWGYAESRVIKVQAIK